MRFDLCIKRGRVPLMAFSPRGLLFFIIAGALLFTARSAEAIPAFAKKYSAPCALCHSSWPMLNAVGYRFKVNGYQMEGGRDGADAGKITPSFDLHLDTGKANPPLSLRLDGGFSVFQPRSGASGLQANNFPCCVEGNRLRMYAAGTVDQDAAYFISYKFGDPQIEQGYIRFTNLFGAGYLGVDLGALRTADSDAVSPNREWFGGGTPAFFGTSNTGGRAQGMASGYTDTGARFFGNPDYGPFSYDIIIATGTRSVGSAVNSRGSAYSFMGRVDAGGFAGSFRYWNNKSGELDFKKEAGAAFYSYDVGQNSAPAALEFAPSRMSPDEKTQDYLFTFGYESERWQVEGAYVWNDFSLDTRTTGTDTYSRETARRTGLSLDWIYRFSSRIAMGVRYGNSTVASYNETLNGTVTNVAPASAAQWDVKVELLPVQNARISIQWTLDTSNEQARTDLTGKGYDQQNKLFLLWDWAI